MAFEDSSHIDAFPASGSGGHESDVLEQHVSQALERERTMTRALRSIAFREERLQALDTLGIEYDHQAHLRCSSSGRSIARRDSGRTAHDLLPSPRNRALQPIRRRG